MLLKMNITDEIFEENVILDPFPPFGPIKCVTINVPKMEHLQFYTHYVSHNNLTESVLTSNLNCISVEFVFKLHFGISIDV